MLRLQNVLLTLQTFKQQKSYYVVFFSRPRAPNTAARKTGEKNGGNLEDTYLRLTSWLAVKGREVLGGGLYLSLAL